ncbi:hypothetical protein FYJ85_13625 [Victivallaceae bacterium BBE-744-WT-12]|uniref:NfeD-like partner-binding protein n=1 Tax=Victivallis lenta TaxID=2606640 RepID=A0A844G6J6_9BACT|nr:hypothetical protein [Victivallis lenta]MBS1453515.1 hypothetical protein [Lentisphaeria bacterium]MBS5532963.1 hypothetical protein [bacterium]MST98078.1 hypothetical protein [Victivallis lenta]HBP06219.1 hypothetical protein [Lentisphaeria bacterium]HCH87648.1 hypothetical protein [Lentisphaeria bacterium]
MENSSFLTGIGEFLAGAGNLYLFIAVTGSVIFALQFIMTVAGIHSDVELDGAGFDVDSHDISDIQGLNFFSLKAIVAFVTFFGWGGYFYGHLGWTGLAIAFGCGLIMMFLTALVVSLLLKMQQSGNITPAELVGQRGTVYLTVPAGRAPGGMVTVTLPGCTRQVSARADDELKTGTAVVISENLGGGSFLVVKS